MKSARQAALSVLLKIELDKAYSTFALNDRLQKEKLNDERDSALAVHLVYGVLERKMTLDYNLSLYLTSDIKKLNPTALCILRLGAYQILFGEKIPDSAAVNESVKLASENKVSYAKGLINAVLRKVASNGLKLPDGKDMIRYLSVLYSFSPDLIRLFMDSYGEEKTLRILKASCNKRPLYIRMNTVKCDKNAFMNELAKDDTIVKPTDLSDCFMLESTKRLQQVNAFTKGMFYVQDISSQTVCSIVGVKPGDTVVDCCAAPGGKSFTLAQYMNNKGKIISCDMYPHKVNLIEEGAEKLSLSCINTVCLDARQLKNHIKAVDVVYCDVPCSGFGVTGRKPEIRYKTLNEINDLPMLQKEILNSVCSMVKPGGILVYSTCTLNPSENENVVDEFLRTHSDFMVSEDEKYRHYCGEAQYITLFPEENSGDGFFAAKLIRKE